MMTTVIVHQMVPMSPAPTLVLMLISTVISLHPTIKVIEKKQPWAMGENRYIASKMIGIDKLVQGDLKKPANNI